ncbi:hypothetical protein CFN78_20620 [Amycolatopsis antarctica]|uniref:Thioredoxin-like fold domain-containing protein n=1 Tax=Amycolatopsis antarctica TaxID=1854586 RepID=A0A263CYI4_9PSEU|nr:thioredoxin domain-containing protein [Amycolatopsis antarctica]OZM71212.1 hypothetical protein CFN78_20620 [Amycolatopsis antarctica]
MGGAERNARKRRQQQAAGAQAVASARGGGGNRKVIVAVVGVVVLAAAVVGGVVWTNSSKNETEGSNIAVSAGEAPAYPQQRDGTVVVAGNQDAPIAVDVYADFLCPVCAKFEEVYGGPIAEQVTAGKIKVRYHMVPLLNEQSDPPGYSLDSANASLCAADAGKFQQYHDSLFAEQPAEGGRGYDKAQLIQLGTSVGINDAAFGACVNNGTYDQQLTAEFEKAANDPALKQTQQGETFFGTPTVVADGRIVDWSTDQEWLSKVVAAQG